MKKLIFILLGTLISIPLVCQVTFSKSFDLDEQTDEGVAIRVVQDGYLILAGSYCFSNSLQCYSILKTDFNGNIVWKKQFNNNLGHIKPVDGYGNHGICVTNEGNEIYYSGIIENQETLLDCFLMKTDSQGDSIWFHSYGSPYDDFSATVFQRTDSTLLLFSDLSTDPNNDVIWLLETDLKGNIIWENTYGELNRNVARQDILQLDNGDIVFTHFSCERKDICYFGDSISLNITKIDNHGDVLWTEPAYKFTEYWSYSSMIALDNGGFLLSFYRTNFEPGWFYPPILIWLDSLGKVVDEYYFPENPESIINNIIKTSSGLVIGVGYVDKFELGFAGWVFALNQEGELLWNREIVDFRFPERVVAFNAVTESENGGLIITGLIYDTLVNHIPTQRNKNIVLVKLDSMGCLEPGCSDLQIVTDLSESVSPTEFISIYPNPAQNELYVEVNQVLEKSINLNINFYNTIGQEILMKRLNVEGIASVDVSSLVNGIYFIQIIDENGFLMKSAKIIITK